MHQKCLATGPASHLAGQVSSIILIVANAILHSVKFSIKAIKSKADKRNP